MGSADSPSSTSDASKQQETKDSSHGPPTKSLDDAGLNVRRWWKFSMRPDDDEEPQDWWFASTAIPLLASTTGPLANVMSIAALITSWRNNYDPQHPAAVLYLVSSMALMVNMLGYFLGHYRQHFELSDEQRNLILQTMMFFIWLAGGAGVFTRVDPGWQFVDALYFCDVTILTVGFGDFHPINDTSRGLVFPYSVGGIITLGLLVNSIRKFAQEISRDNIVKSHVEKRRVQTIDRSVMATSELEKPSTVQLENRHVRRRPFRSGMQRIRRVGTRKHRLILLQEEKDRFDAMRSIQKSTSDFKKYSALTMSVIAFGLLWCVGAIGFWQAEQKSQGLTYFQALYFCYVSLLTIGYGDLSPTSNAGKPFFIVWSLIAVPTMTILISDMGDTVIASFKRGTFTLADWTVLPKAGLWRSLLERNPQLLHWLQSKASKAEEEKRLAQGFPVGPADENPPPPTLQQVANLSLLDEHTLARKLSSAIRSTANDLLHSTDTGPKRYSYEEWAVFTRLIRFSSLSTEAEIEEEEEEQGLVEWDWIGEDSPMLAEKTESEWLLDRLCESLDRWMRRQEGRVRKGKKKKKERASREREGRE
ncbi:MAG: hypothetical protein Q9220_003675 [cf. Caloplaca sp. 1 TL-2023]